MFIELLISTTILTAEPGQPTEVIGTAATPNGQRKEILVIQPQYGPNPFGYIAPLRKPPLIVPARPISISASPIKKSPTKQIINQSESVNPQDLNPLDYQNKIKNTIYQDGNRLIDVQSLPIQDINQALEPNLQPTITDYPAD